MPVIGLTVALLLIAGLLLLAPTAASGAPKPCRDADLVPSRSAQAERFKLALRCLINRERAAHGLDRLRVNRNLQRSSRWQAQDMLKHEYFDHHRQDGPDFAQRIDRFGYDGSLAGENLAWADAQSASPAALVELWMGSTAHRENILERAFDDQAIAVLWSASPAGGDFSAARGAFLIVVNQFGER